MLYDVIGPLGAMLYFWIVGVVLIASAIAYDDRKVTRSRSFWDSERILLIVFWPAVLVFAIAILLSEFIRDVF